MQSKLTLRIDDELITKAKKFARQRGKSLSRLVSEYLSYIISGEEPAHLDLPPHVKSLYGSLSDTDIDESQYKEHILEKYL
ncbi:MAG: antitoxin [Calditrichia bacterium]|nr:antitoxin [Calditrichia bacterium]